jgi:DNA-binding NtrC family response regulator
MEILILEDDEDVGIVYASALKGAGHNVRVYSSFELARKALRESVPDGLLTDVRVGSYNGLQLALLFRTMAESSPIVVVSGHDDAVIQEEARRVPAFFLVKPVSLDAIVSIFAE